MVRFIQFIKVYFLFFLIILVLAQGLVLAFEGESYNFSDFAVTMQIMGIVALGNLLLYIPFVFLSFKYQISIFVPTILPWGFSLFFAYYSIGQDMSNFRDVGSTIVTLIPFLVGLFSFLVSTAYMYYLSKYQETISKD